MSPTARALSRGRQRGFPTEAENWPPPSRHVASSRRSVSRHPDGVSAHLGEHLAVDQALVPDTDGRPLRSGGTGRVTLDCDQHGLQFRIPGERCRLGPQCRCLTTIHSGIPVQAAKATAASGTFIQNQFIAPLHRAAVTQTAACCLFRTRDVP